MENVKINRDNRIWAHYKIRCCQPAYRGRKVVMYHDIADMVGCGWQTVYNVIKRRLDERQYKIVFTD